MRDLREDLDKAIRKTLNDPYGAGSDLTVLDEYDNWITIDGNLDVEHLVSVVLAELGLE